MAHCGQTILPLPTGTPPRGTKHDPSGPAADGTRISQKPRATLRSRTSQTGRGENQIGRGRWDQVVPHLRVDEGRGFGVEDGEGGRILPCGFESQLLHHASAVEKERWEQHSGCQQTLGHQQFGAHHHQTN